jgi:hypothetical protein
VNSVIFFPKEVKRSCLHTGEKVCGCCCEGGHNLETFSLSSFFVWARDLVFHVTGVAWTEGV